MKQSNTIVDIVHKSDKKVIFGKKSIVKSKYH